MQLMNRLAICLLSMILSIVSMTMAMHQSSEIIEKSSNYVPPPASVSPSSLRFIAEETHPLKLIMRPSIPDDHRRHIRSVDQQEPAQSSTREQLFEGDDSAIPSEDEPELTHKTLRSIASSDMLRYIPQASLAQENKYGLNRWYFPGFSDFSRGGRPDSNFIRFGRNAHFDSASGGSLVNSNNANKKNNFIRLGRENPRQNNFIRLGRSGIWGNDDRFGSKIGYFPDYYSHVSGGRSFADFPPLPYDTTDILRQG